MLRIPVVFCILFLLSSSLFAQNVKNPKYPSLFWEISGNGLQKPSYLFGTMHVSNKMAFHLSDSFYNAIQKTDMVALELNPEFWQKDMVKMDAAQQQLENFYKDNTTEYLTQSSFKIEDYYEKLKAALTADPQQINSLLYRTFSVQQDYEENTYLDLYIYQTGRKYGKLAGGVEDYYQTQKILLEAYAAMAKERLKKTPDYSSSQPSSDIDKKIQEAYRHGDLDLLDSLERISFNSQAYIDKFLYQRNNIQANSIDTLIKHHSIFVGVGAAHLPGANGVIELLRRKGYTLRPIFMQSRDTKEKESVEKLKVPVKFNAVSTEDGFINMQMPGPLYKMPVSNYNNFNDNWQYADMDNGVYYMLTRVKTHAGLLSQSSNEVLKKTDSLLYENIPGKILTKKPIEKNGYKGFDILNKTRRGDLQRYNIFVTPYEILIFKMSGNDDYVNGTEAQTFFNSINIKPQPLASLNFVSPTAGFHVRFPQYPHINNNTYTDDGINCWEFEASDSISGNTYAVYEKNVTNLNFMEEDSFDLGLMEESFKSSGLIDKQLSRSFTKMHNYNALNMQFALKNGHFIHAKAILKGPEYFMLLQTSRRKNIDTAFFNSFGFEALQYQAASLYTDTMLDFEVRTPVKPTLDSSLANFMYNIMHDESFTAQLKPQNYWPKNQYAMFKNDSTAESVLVGMYEYPKYYSAKDSASFWKKQLRPDNNNDAFLFSQTSYKPCGSCQGYKLIWRDTNTVRQVINYKILKNNRLYNLYTITDTGAESSFIKDFFQTFKPLDKSGPSVYASKTNIFFDDLYSHDSLAKTKARNAIPNVYYGAGNIDRIVNFINNLNYGEEDYFELKQKFIKELGLINDSCCTNKVVRDLEDIYKKTADTAYFQNEVFSALENLKTATAYATLKKLLLQDPPLFDEYDDYSDFFEKMQDSLQLTRAMFPEILQLTTIEDYKEPVINALATLLDSGFIKAGDYKDYFTRIYFDAKIEMKKQQNAEEKLLEKQSQKNFDINDAANEDMYEADKYYATDVGQYAALLLPFYDSVETLPKFFNRLLQSKDTGLQLATAILLIRNNKTVPDSILNNIASKDNYRASLLEDLEDINRTSLFPSKYKKQELVARSLLLNNSSATGFAGIEPEGKKFVSVKGEKGYVYFFRYKLKNDDDWKIGISGLQPEDLTEVNTSDAITALLDEKLTNDKTYQEQFNEQLLRLVFKQHKSAAHFFNAAEN